MFITHSYLCRTGIDFSYYFYMLYQDYIEYDKCVKSEIEAYVERLARNIKDNGCVFAPFKGDIDNIKNEFHSKQWDQNELNIIRNTPGIFITDRPFSLFSPREHSWLYLSFYEDRFAYTINTASLYALDIFTKKLLSDTGNDNLFHNITKAVSNYDKPKFLNIFEAKPGIFGFSIDLLEAGKQIPYYKDWLFRRIIG